MKCGDVDMLLAAGLRPSGAAFQAHAAECPVCDRLAAWAPPTPRTDLSAAAMEEIRRTLQTGMDAAPRLPAMPAVVSGAALLNLGVAAVCTAAMGTAGWRALNAGPAVLLVALALAVTVAAAFNLLASIRPAASPWLRPLAPAVLPLAGVPLLAALLFPVEPDPDFFRHGIACLGVGLATAAASMLAAGTAARRGYSVNTAVTGALAGVLGGAAALTALPVFCPHHDFWHVAVWHTLPAVIPIAGGYFAGWRAAR